MFCSRTCANRFNREYSSKALKRYNDSLSPDEKKAQQERMTEGKKRSELFAESRRVISRKSENREKARATLKLVLSNPVIAEKRSRNAVLGVSKSNQSRFARTRNWYGTPTVYNGVRFRSKLESGFAAWCDSVGWKWQYEPRVISYIDDLGKTRSYLPDFYIESEDLYVEVKGMDYDPEYYRVIERSSGISIWIVEDDTVHKLWSLSDVCA